MRSHDKYANCLSIGYISNKRRLASRYDGTVRNSTGAVVQFLYGEDGMDGTAIESQRVEHLRMDAQRFRVRAAELSPNPNPPGACAEL